MSQEPSFGLALHPGDQEQLGFSSQGTGWCWALSGHGDTHIGVISHLRDFGAFSDDPTVCQFFLGLVMALTSRGPGSSKPAPPNLKSDANQDHLGYVSAQPLLSIIVSSDCKPATWLASL